MTSEKTRLCLSRFEQIDDFDEPSRAEPSRDLVPRISIESERTKSATPTERLGEARFEGDAATGSRFAMVKGDSCLELRRERKGMQSSLLYVLRDGSLIICTAHVAATIMERLGHTYICQLWKVLS